MELEEDEVEEANHDLLQAGGNVHQLIQAAQQEHLNAQKQRRRRARRPCPSALAEADGMVGQARAWLELHRKRQVLEQAREHTADSAAALAAERASAGPNSSPPSRACRSPH